MIKSLRTLNRHLLAAILLSVVLTLEAQEGYKGNPRVDLPVKSNIEDIVRIAAMVTPSPRQLKWQQMELTTFLHFTMNTFYDREWGYGNEDPARFNPVEFDARQWVKVCKDAGSRCVILTCKHHDGFCLWPSRYTTHSVSASPWRNGTGDIVRDVSQACKDAGLGFGIYLSPWDRHEQTYGTPEYNHYFVNQLTELLTNYGHITEVWFDGACGEGPNGKKQVYDWNAYYSLIRKLQPEAVIAVMGPDVRWVGTESGYGRETEWSVVPVDLSNQNAIAAASQKEQVSEGFIPEGDMMASDLGSREVISKAKNLIWYPSEVDVSIRPGWFWHENENGRVKTPEKLMDIYFSSVGRNSVLLLNIPPDRRGLIHENDQNILQEWRRLLDLTFAKNLVAGASVNLINPKSPMPDPLLFDGNESTSILLPGSGEQVLEFSTGKEITFDVLCLQENIRIGQRVEKFRLEAFVGGNWHVIARGTTIGYKRLLRFEPVTSGSIRLVIEQSRLEPALAEVGLYLQPPSVKASPATASFTDTIEVVLKSVPDDAVIRYTLDGSVPDDHSPVYTKPLQFDHSVVLNYAGFTNDGQRGFNSTSQYNKARFGVKLKNPPDPRYDGGGPLGLVDGATGSLDHADGRWTGISGNTLDALVDLGKMQNIHSVQVNFLEVTASWIFRPVKVEISVSADGVNFRQVHAVDMIIPQSDNSEIFTIATPVDGKFRFVKVIAYPLLSIPSWHAGAGSPSWIFADEIKIE